MAGKRYFERFPIPVQTMKWIRTVLPTAKDCLNEIARPHRSLLPVGLHALSGERAGESAEDCADHPCHTARKRPVRQNEAKRQTCHVSAGHRLYGFPLRLESLQQGSQANGIPGTGL